MRLTVLLFYLNRLVFNNVTYFTISKKVFVSTKNKIFYILLFSVHLMVIWLTCHNILKRNRHFTLTLNFDIPDGFNEPNSWRTAIYVVSRILNAGGNKFPLIISLSIIQISLIFVCVPITSVDFWINMFWNIRSLLYFTNTVSHFPLILSRACGPSFVVATSVW
jgi:hypothetical protein